MRKGDLFIVNALPLLDDALWCPDILRFVVSNIGSVLSVISVFLASVASSFEAELCLAQQLYK